MVLYNQFSVAILRHKFSFQVSIILELPGHGNAKVVTVKNCRIIIIIIIIIIILIIIIIIDF
jgi:hypothetical protein